MTSKIDEIALKRHDLRLKLLNAGVATMRYLIEVANDGGHQAVVVQLRSSDGSPVGNAKFRAEVARVLSDWVDAAVPGWYEGDGGRSQIDWSVAVDAFDHQHFDNVKFERRRLLDAAADMNASSNILADNARAALLLAMGDLAPKDKSAQQHLRDAARIAIDQTRTDQKRFLTDAQRELLVNGIAGTRVKCGSEDEWISDVTWHGYVGYEHAPDVELVQKLATESLDDVVEGICGPARITAESEYEQKTRQGLVEVFTLEQSLEALNAVAEVWGDAMLVSLSVMGVIPEAEGDDALSESESTP